ncbi:MAG: undecaprenyl-phosphate glucose phosphotransferase [Rhizobiales bacterium]|nr:undecaprenyl-phosphate glucose phosphotransferase [Hyphomicrobiales bacterium]
MTARMTPRLEIRSADALPERARLAAARLSDRPISPLVLGSGVWAVDLVALILLGVLLSLLTSASPFAYRLAYLGAIAAPVFATLLARSQRGYDLAALRDPVAALARLLLGWALTMLLAAAVGFLLGVDSSGARQWLVAYAIVGIIYFLVSRAFLARLIARWSRSGRLERRAVIVGGGADAAKLIEALERDPTSGIRICGIFDDRADARSPDEIAGHAKLGTIAELVAFARVARIDLLLVAFPTSAEERLAAILRQLFVLPADIRLSALGSRLRLTPRAYSYVGEVPFLDLLDRPISGWDALAKRCFDIVVGTLALILLSPLMLGAAIAIRLDSPGPILFRQRRFGFNNEVIEVLKFRSMYHHLTDPTAKVAVTRDDPRVTRVGRFIRRSSIDELPQLFNVLRGELSLVGPRPHAVNAHTADRLWEEVVDGYFARHRVKPGITGWAQINGWRGEIDVPEKIQRRVECDLHYIERWSLLFDLYIILVTPLRLIRSENAF